MRVFLTGASSGIGAALACHYAAAGVTLGLAARRQDRLAELIAELPGEHACYALDVADAAALQAAAGDFIARYGCPDIVIANAGISVGTLADDADDLHAFRRVLETNVLGMAQTLQPFIAAMKARGSGRLVGIASVAGIRGLPGAGAYCASKAATITYLEALRGELRGSGVEVVTIVPGYIATPMTAVNRYPMPFLLAADVAARRFARAIERGTRYTVIPWQMGVVAKLLRLLPNPLFDAIFARAGRKPRGLDL
ncbi:MAG: short chain dehydrogenase [Rhodocyclaceae bacterium]|nr:MAG: short chain dehydrogenase [Rhodocyclaceae bacterium]TND06058.1 MAG: short chain dehydrogenase [Rhodocyclaceae bacterium]